MNSDFMNSIGDSINQLASGAVDFIPKLLTVLLLLIVGTIVANLVSKLLGTLVNYIENSKPVVKSFQKVGIRRVDIDGVVSLFAKWTILVIFFGAAVDVLGLDVLTNTFESLIDFVPNILAATAVAALTLVASNVAYDIVNTAASKAHVTSHNFIARAAQIAVLVFGLPLAAAQLGLDLTLITNNLTVIVAGIMLAFGLAFGLGGKEVASKILNDLYKNWKKK